MARKTKEEAEKTKRLIIMAAQKLFYEQGVVRTSLQQIAQEAGLTRGAVYWHFRDKFDLLHAIADESYLPNEELLDRLALIETTAPLDVLRDNCMSKLKELAHDPVSRRVFTILIYRCEHLEEIRKITERSDKCRQKTTDCLMKIFKKISQKGQLNKTWSPQAASCVLQHLVYGFVHEEMVWPAPCAQRDLAREKALSAFFNALRA